MTTHARFDSTLLPEPIRTVAPDELVLLLDVDGTLAPIVPDPAAAAVPPSTLALLREAVARCALVGVVTGRTIERARELVPVEGVWYAAVHGMHLVGPDGSEEVCPDALAAREHVRAAATLAQTVGWRYEDKEHTVTVHLRQRGELGQALDPAHVRAQLAMVLHPTAVAVHEAKQALEVRPATARTKADAVRRLVDAAGRRARAVVYVGDDRTDLDAITALAEVRDRHDVATLAVAIGGAEAPAELLRAADLVLDEQGAVDDLLAALMR